MAWEKRSPTMALAMLIGGDFIYKDMLRVAFGLKKLSNTVLLFETKKPNVDLSRNILTALALKDKCDWIFFLDMDVVPPLDVIPRLLSHNLPIVTALYWRRYDRLDPCVYRMPDEGIPVTLSEFEVRPGLVFEVEACGAGCLLVHSSVFEKLIPTVEKFDIEDPESKKKLTCYKFWEHIVHENVNLSEDIVLASRVKGLGFKVFVDTTLRCGHLSNVMVKEGTFEQTPFATGQDL